MLLAGTSNIALAEKVLIVYFSYTGNSKAIAKKIKDGIKSSEGVDLYRVKTKEKYTKDIDKLMPQAKKEAENKDFRPALKKKDVDESKYQKIIAVFPAWYSTAPKAMIAALEGMDLKGKEVCTVVTHGGGPGTSEEDAKAACKGAKFGNCTDIYCDYPANGKFNEEAIKEFIDHFNRAE